MNWSGVILLWLVLMAAEVLHGVLRGILLVPRVGPRRASQIGVFSGSLIIVGLTVLLVDWLAPTSTRALLATGGIWVFLTLGFEVALGRWGFGYSWKRIAEEFDLRRGGLMSLGLLVMGLSPLLVAWACRRPPFGG